MEEQKRLKFREMNVGKPVPIEIDYSGMEDAKVLSGSAISRGKATGKARVISCVEDANKLEKGEIMVAAFTDIGWSPYYSVAGALVTEVGSVLSHGAVVAREYALPLVSNVAYATKLIKTGSVICVDGNKGEVAIIDCVQQS
jgi:pyruvate,water dikinase